MCEYMFLLVKVSSFVASGDQCVVLRCSSTDLLRGLCEEQAKMDICFL